MKTAWLNDPELKRTMMAGLKEHRRLDRIIQRVGYSKDKRGCAIGCLFKNYNHAYGAEISGIPEAVLYLADKIFEGLPVKDAPDFAVSWPSAIKTGADLSGVSWAFREYLLRENFDRVSGLKDLDAKIKTQVLSAINGVLDLGPRPDEAARSAARSAAEIAAESAESAAEIARSAESARSAAWSAAWSAARSAARSAAWKRYAEEFIRLLKSKPSRRGRKGEK